MSENLFAEVENTARPSRARKFTNEFGPAVELLATRFAAGKPTTLTYDLKRVADDDEIEEYMAGNGDMIEKVTGRARRMLNEKVAASGHVLTAEMRNSEDDPWTSVFWVTEKRFRRTKSEAAASSENTDEKTANKN